MEIEHYIHHGKEIAVLSELKGQHREHCLCYRCGKFKPSTDENCLIAQTLYEHCYTYNLVTPVYECSQWEEKPRGGN